MDFMANAHGVRVGPAPLVINMSGGAAGTNQTGTDSTSRKLDDKVWTNRQAYVVCRGNNGPGAGTVWSPGVAKNALTVGNVLDSGHLTVGDIANDSSRGPTGDDRMKPNVVAPGSTVTSARAGTTNQYSNLSGTSMATPHVSGLVATLMEHYPEFQGNPALLRAHLMASAIAHDDVTGNEQRLRARARLGVHGALGAVRRQRLVQSLVLGNRELHELAVPGHHGARRHPAPRRRAHLGRADGERRRDPGGHLGRGPVRRLPGGLQRADQGRVRRVFLHHPASTMSSTSSSTIRRRACIG